MPDQDIPVPPMPIENQAARNDQIWERAKADTEKFIADAAVLIMGGQNTAMVADQFAGMAVRSHPAHVATMMSTLLVMIATDRLQEKGLLPEMPLDPFADSEDPDSVHDLVEAFVNELTALTIRHRMAVHAQGIFPVHAEGKETGQLQSAPMAEGFAWSPELARYVCQSPYDDAEAWKVP